MSVRSFLDKDGWRGLYHESHHKSLAIYRGSAVKENGSHVASMGGKRNSKHSGTELRKDVNRTSNMIFRYEKIE
jgi:hypothetical protein